MGITFLFIILGVIIYAVVKSSKKEATFKYDNVPVTLHVKTSFDYENKIENSLNSDDYWTPKNKPVRINNFTINDGMLYIGSGLAAVDNKYDIEPSLMDPKLSIKQPDIEPNRFNLGYWPSYKRLTPEARYSYLKWLSEGRKNPNIEIGFVFIFFYGLERRLISDIKTSKTARAEINEIIIEVERLQNIYKNSSSFYGYSSRFLDFIKVKYNAGRIKVILPKESNYSELPLSFRVNLARYCVNQKPIPPVWAFFWFQNYPYYRFLRTPAERCQKEFVELYKKKYSEKFGEGLIINEPKKRLVISYKPASNSFSTTQTLSISSLPDVVHLSKPLKEIEKIVESSIDELDAYSRYLGRNPNNKNSFSSLSLLPKTIDIRKYNDRILELDNLIKGRLGERLGVIIESDEILKYWSVKIKNKISKTENMVVINILDRLGYLIEPDLRFTDIKLNPSGKVVIFKKSEDSPESPSKEYHASYIILSLAIAVCSADGDVSEKEKKHLINHIQDVLQLTKSERIRLAALFTYLIIEPPNISIPQKYIDEINDIQRRSILQFMIAIANADNKIEPEEIKIIKKIYKFFNYDSEAIYSDIHNFQTAYAKEPVVIKSSKVESDHVYKVPNQASLEVKSFSLNSERINDILKNTKQVMEILSPIFQQNDEFSQSAEVIKSSPQSDNIANLDSYHTQIVRKLIEKSVFPRSEFEELCSSFNLLPNGVIETINENFYEFYDDALIEDEEDLVINNEIVKEINNG